MKCLHKDVIRASGVGVLTIFRRIKRLLQMMALIMIVAFMTSVLYQNVHGLKDLESYHLPLTEPSKTTNHPMNIGLKNHAINEVADIISNPSRPQVNTAKAKNNDRPKDIFVTDYLLKQRHIHEFSVTATPKPTTTNLNDIFITVKTTKLYHDTRLALIIKTWFQLAKDQTWFFTDTDNQFFQHKTSGHLINTNCSMGHLRKALCCKMSVEFDTFLESGKKWFCHFDDDNYVNIPKLVELLSNYSPTLDWYLGKPSIASPLEIYVDNNDDKQPHKKISFVFATGGAGFCISRTLALKMLPIAGFGKFMSIGDRIGLPDDVTMGYIIEHLLKVPLTVIETFHSHLEPMDILPKETFKEQVTFSYGHIKNNTNVLLIDGFDDKIDPTRLLSLHCHLYPNILNGKLCSPQALQMN
ncbi:fringe glycosyltransferase [Contarinia nasturtii]|uniref:fringe glycosyltransferase n=1 Tax=Contarinia nasturtii TaxID=265458 RepID=UPI0012D3B8CC|nr:fringe glycosyltransferase [Contarinia nasturtii]